MYNSFFSLYQPQPYSIRQTTILCPLHPSESVVYHRAFTPQEDSSITKFSHTANTSHTTNSSHTTKSTHAANSTHITNTSFTTRYHILQGLSITYHSHHPTILTKLTLFLNQPNRISIFIKHTSGPTKSHHLLHRKNLPSKSTSPHGFFRRRVVSLFPHQVWLPLPSSQAQTNIQDSAKPSATRSTISSVLAASSHSLALKFSKTSCRVSRRHLGEYEGGCECEGTIPRSFSKMQSHVEDLPTK